MVAGGAGGACCGSSGGCPQHQLQWALVLPGLMSLLDGGVCGVQLARQHKSPKVNSDCRRTKTVHVPREHDSGVVDESPLVLVETNATWAPCPTTV
jgi:hypothetical protein